MGVAAGADDKLAHAAVVFEHALRALGGEALVVVVVAREDDIHAVVVDRLEERGRGAAAVVARTPARLVPVGERADVGVGGQVGAQPEVLFRAGVVVDLAVERHDVPGAKVE